MTSSRFLISKIETRMQGRRNKHFTPSCEDMKGFALKGFFFKGDEQSVLHLVAWFIPVAPTWSVRHPRNALFHFSFLI
jgi:hypothetical protein